jgi:hypothetical protein
MGHNDFTSILGPRLRKLFRARMERSLSSSVRQALQRLQDQERLTHEGDDTLARTRHTAKSSCKCKDEAPR